MRYILMKPWVFFCSLLLVSCVDQVDEEKMARRLDRNNELLVKQYNLLEKSFRLQHSSEPENPAWQLFDASSLWLDSLEIELQHFSEIQESQGLFHKTALRFNDSMKQHSGLLLDWSPDPIESYQNELIRAWKDNNLILLRIAILEKCMELHEVKSKSATSSLIPVIYSTQPDQVQEGRNAMFNVAFKSKKPEWVQLKIDKAWLDGNPVSPKNIEIDQYTQRVILFSLEKGHYLIEGHLILINEKGEKDAYPFRHEFTVN